MDDIDIEDYEALHKHLRVALLLACDGLGRVDDLDHMRRLTDVAESLLLYLAIYDEALDAEEVQAWLR